MRNAMISDTVWMMYLENDMMTLLYQQMGMPCRHHSIDISLYRAYPFNIYMRDGEFLFALTLMIQLFSSVMSSKQSIS